jgi:hypothetical protein
MCPTVETRLFSSIWNGICAQTRLLLALTKHERYLDPSQPVASQFRLFTKGVNVIVACNPYPAILVLPLLLLGACSAPPMTSIAPGGKQNVPAATAPPVKPLQLNGVFSCTAHVDGKLPAITWKQIPFRLENDRLSALYTFTDSFKHQDSVMFSGTLTGQSGRITATAVRTDGSPNFSVEMAGTPTSMIGPMMQGQSQRPVRSCTLVLKRA